MGLMDRMKEAADQAVSLAKESVGGMAQAASEDTYEAPGGMPNGPVPNDSDRLLAEVTSHIEGKNAKVRVYPDRIEWEKPKSVSGAKLTAAVLTVGMSAAATGGIRSRAGTGTEVIYLDSVTSVITKRDTMFNDKVSVIASGNTIDFRVSKSEAEKLKNTILQARTALRRPQSAQVSQPTGGTQDSVIPSAPPSEVSITDKLKELAELHAAGVLSDDEFTAAKAKALST